MINLGQIATHIHRYMNEENMSRQEAEAKALKTLNIQEDLTESQREELDKLIKNHEEAVQDELERAENETQEIQEEATPETDDAPIEE